MIKKVYYKIRKYIKILRGKIILAFVCRKPGNYIFCLHDLGSVIFPLAFLEAAKDSFNRYPIYIVTVKKYFGLCRLFYDDVNIKIINRSVRPLMWYIRIRNKLVTRNKKYFVFYEGVNFKKVLDWGYKSTNIPWTSYTLLISFVYGINPTSKIRYGNPENINQEKKNSYIRKYDILKGKSVVLIPYTVSGVHLPAFFWEQLASQLNKKGYKVYTNTLDDEKVIHGTTILNPPIEFVPSLVEYAGYAVTIQTGLGDLLHLCHVPCSMVQNYAKECMNNGFKKSFLDYKRVVSLPKSEKNRYDLSLVGTDPFVFDKSYTDIYDSVEKLNDLVKTLLNDVHNAIPLV